MNMIGSPLSAENIKRTTELGRKLREERERMRTARGGKPLANAPGEWANHEWANEGDGCFLAIGPQIKTRFT